MLYLAEVFAVVKQFGFLVHGYADDLQLYDHAALSASMSLVSRLSDCVEAVKAWMAYSRLTELIWLGASRYVQLCPTGPLNIAGASIRPSQQVRDLVSFLILSCRLRHMSVTLHLFATVRFGSYACCTGLFHSKQLMHSCVRSFTPASTIATPFLPMLHRRWWLPSSPFCQGVQNVASGDAA